MTNKEASNVLRLFANLIEINGLPQERILTFRKAYEQAIVELESNKRPHGEWIDHWNEGYVECPFCHKPITGGDLNFCVKCGADMRPKKKLQTPSCLTNPERQAELLERYKEE